MLAKMNISEEYLRSVTGTFDLEILFDLELEKKNILTIGAVKKCISLVYLDLSQNKISDISDISHLVELKFADLSFNNISDIKPLSSCHKLRNLKLQGNNIDCPLPNELKSLKKLEILSFKCINLEEDKNKNVSNPICNMNNYRNAIFLFFNNLKRLDNIPKGMDEFNFDFLKENDDLENKIDFDSYKFDFNDKIKLNANDIISNDDIENSKKEIKDKYDEYEKGVEELKKQIQNMKI